MAWGRDHVSLDTPVDEDGDTSLGDLMAQETSPGPGPDGPRRRVARPAQRPGRPARRAGGRHHPVALRPGRRTPAQAGRHRRQARHLRRAGPPARARGPAEAAPAGRPRPGRLTGHDDRSACAAMAHGRTARRPASDHSTDLRTRAAEVVERPGVVDDVRRDREPLLPRRPAPRSGTRPSSRVQPAVAHHPLDLDLGRVRRPRSPRRSSRPGRSRRAAGCRGRPPRPAGAAASISAARARPAGG